MLSPTGGKSDYSRLLPPPAKLLTATTASLASRNEMTVLPTLTPERVQQKLQSPRRITMQGTTAEAGESLTLSQQHTRFSAFTSPHQNQRQRRLPTESALANGELSFFTRVNDISTSSSNINNSMDSFQIELPQNLRPVNQSFYNSPQRTTATGVVSLEYISPATTPAKSQVDDGNTSTPPMIGEDFLGVGDAFSHINNNSDERNVVSDCDVAGMLIPVKGTTKFATKLSSSNVETPLKATFAAIAPVSHFLPGGDTGVGVNQPVHLLEQQHEHLLLQQEQELLQRQIRNEVHKEQQQQDDCEEELALQRQLQNEFQDEQNTLSRLEYQFHEIDETIGEKDVSRQQTIVHKFSSTPAQARDELSTQLKQSIRQVDDSWQTDPAVHTVLINPLNDNGVHPNLMHPKVSQKDILLEPTIIAEHVKNVETFESHDESPRDLGNVEASEHSNIVQRQVIERMMVMPPEQVRSYSNQLKRNRRSTAASRTCREKNTSTPRISNSSSGSESDAVSMEEDIKIQYEIEKNWPTNTVDSLKSTMHRAVGKLKTLATHIAKSSNDSIPEAVNTSTESSSSSTDPDTISGLDLNDLTGELRNNAKEIGTQVSTDNNEIISAHHQRRNSATSFDTLGSPKPASLAEVFVPPSNLQKPVPLNPAKTSPRLPTPSKKKFDSSSNVNGQTYIVPKSTVDNRTRAVTPIVRMRNQGTVHMETPVEDETKQTQRENDTKGMKQRHWKGKMKIVKKSREKEKSKLQFENENKQNSYGDKTKQRQPAKKAKLKVRKTRKEPSFFVVAGHRYQIPTGIPTCKGDVIELLERFMSTRCGNIDDTFDGDDDSVNSNEFSFYSDDYESGSDSETSTVDKQLEKAVSKTTARIQAVNHIAEKVPKHAITVDINDKQFIRQFIANVTTEGIVLLSHMKNHSKALRRPTKNTAFLRRGTQTSSDNFIGPKLVWNDVKGDEGGEIDLFVIRSLEKATALELENYPYAMPGRSLFLRLNKGVDYVFEAKDETEALRFVHGMRWLIARLAFNLIIGNVSVSCELLDVGEKMNVDDRYGMFPSTVKEETQWTMAMNEATTHLVQEVSKSIL